MQNGPAILGAGARGRRGRRRVAEGAGAGRDQQAGEASDEGNSQGGEAQQGRFIGACRLAGGERRISREGRGDQQGRTARADRIFADFMVIPFVDCALLTGKCDSLVAGNGNISQP